MYYVYVLQSQKDNGIYIGYSHDLKLRLTEHQQGKVQSTKSRLPLELIYYEAYKDKRDATKREFFLKRGRGRELIKELLPYSLSK